MGVTFVEAFFIVDSFQELMLEHGAREVVGAVIYDAGGGTVGVCYVYFD